MDIFGIILMALLTVCAYGLKMMAVRMQLKYWFTNPLEDPESQQYLKRYGAASTLKWHRRRYIAFKSIVPTFTVLWIIVCALVYSMEPNGGTVMTFCMNVLLVLVVLNFASVFYNFKMADRYKRDYPPLADRVKDSLDAEEA